MRAGPRSQSPRMCIGRMRGGERRTVPRRGRAAGPSAAAWPWPDPGHISLGRPGSARTAPLALDRQGCGAGRRAGDPAAAAPRPPSRGG